MYYPKTIEAIEQRLKKKFPELKPIQKEDRSLPEHLLFMIEEIKRMEDLEKAAGWIGWLSAVAVVVYKIITSKEIEKLKREDKNNRQK